MQNNIGEVTDETKLTDPVCGMSVTNNSQHHQNYEQADYYFCSPGCLEKFNNNPEKYLKPEQQETTNTEPADTTVYCADDSCDIGTTVYTCPMHPEIRQTKPGACPKCGMALEAIDPAIPTTRTEYTCPMHPEIIQDHPGNCPKCGMALEAKTITIEEKNEELIDMTRRFWVSTALSIPVFLLAMIADLAPALLPDALSMQAVQWIEFALATPVVIWGGWPFYVRGVQSVISWNLNMFTLIGLGVSVAWSYSMVALLFPGLFPKIMQMHGGLVDVYFEAAAMITTLVLLGQVLELSARSKNQCCN